MAGLSVRKGAVSPSGSLFELLLSRLQTHCSSSRLALALLFFAHPVDYDH